MSLPNTYESQSQSQVQSPSSTQQLTQEVIIHNGNVSNRHLTYPQIRGVIHVFNHHFPKGGKRMSKDERNRRWLTYKNKIFRDYGRVITGKLDSEKAYVKRYSRPLDFLKYKLKRTTNLKLEDLPNEADREYYFEIGGMNDIEALKSKTYDINYDSVERVTNNFQNYNNNRRRKRRKLEDNDDHSNNNHNHNSNRNNSHIQNQHPHIVINEPNISGISSVPPRIINNKRENDSKLNEALVNLNSKLDMYEQEILDKKKIEIYEITKQKWNALKNSVETHFINDPQLIGSMPGIDNQDTIAFDCWMNKYKHIIKDDPQIQGNVDALIHKICVLKTDMSEWNSFVTKWKLNRIFYEDNFTIIWNNVKNDLKIKDCDAYQLTQMDDSSTGEIDEIKQDI